MAELRLARGAVDGLTVHYVSAGSGPTVVLLHGLGGFAESWRHNIGALAARARVYALDLPGFGQSAKPRAPYDLDFFTTAVGAFLDRLGVERASLAGHSLGGAVAVAYALANPGRVERLALVGAVVPGFYRPSLPYLLGALPGLGDVLALFRWAPLYKASIARCLHRPDRAEVDFLVEHAYEARTSREARLAFLATLRHLRADLVDRSARHRWALAGLDRPTLLVHGHQDPVVPPADCQGAAALLPRATLRWIDGCGHFPQIEHPHTVNAWLDDFLVGRRAPR
ncbi:MAG: alpha/beta fold hydrolase [Candidatus Rokubacteria bacterium]|nr:alpha/beta fold hydrolase [Candidatus Rokubacteria bacterium]